MTQCCLQSVKDTKFESNSQRRCCVSCDGHCCLQSVKDTKFESNSQLYNGIQEIEKGCLQSVKDTKFESNSQHMVNQCTKCLAVCSPSKIQSLKAIHNLFVLLNFRTLAVCSPSKIQSLKAIHNTSAMTIILL